MPSVWARNNKPTKARVSHSAVLCHGAYGAEGIVSVGTGALHQATTGHDVCWRGDADACVVSGLFVLEHSGGV